MSQRLLGKLSSVILLLLLVACGSSGGGTSLNIDNDFWFGRAGNATIGLGFQQSGSSITAGLAYIDSSGRARTCCTLRGSLSGASLDVSGTDASGDRLIITGRFSGNSFSGTMTFILSGKRSSYDLTLRYQKELSSTRLDTLTTGGMTFEELSNRLE